jgi:hypothetical protein
MEFEQNAHEVMAYLADLRKDFGRFREDFDLVEASRTCPDEVRRFRSGSTGLTASSSGHQSTMS